MRAIIVFSIVLTQILLAYAQHGGGEANPGLLTDKNALKKFQDNRFGLFIHWGPVTLRGEEISWSRGREIPIAEYDSLYREFNPLLFDAAEWVQTAVDAGMKYIVLTSRHHDGFCLWDSKYTDYDMAGTPYGKGVIKELASECQKQAIDFGIYYSVSDWYHPDYPVEYPSPNYRKEPEQPESPQVKAGMDNYVFYMKNQLKELIDEYDPFVIWFDGEWEWAWTHERGQDMYAYLRNLKQDLLINNRVDKGREGMAGTTASEIYAGDFATPEQEVGKFDNEHAWETCMTIATQWAWKPNDELKSRKECIQTLLKTVGGDGNLLFNVGPMPDGRIEQRQKDLLKAMGDWLKINGEAVYGTRGGPYLPTDYMVSTRKDNKIFLHLFELPGHKLQLPFDKEIKLQSVYLLDSMKQLKFIQEKQNFEIHLPDIFAVDNATVIVLELNKPAGEIPVIERLRY